MISAAEWVAGLPATIKLMVALFAIVGLIRVKVPMWGAFLAGSLALAVLFPMTLPEFASAAVKDGLFSEATLFLSLVVSSILVFSAALNETGQITRIIDAFKALVGTSRLTMVTFPVLIGLLPMPGGAIFSAPMVEAAVKEAGVSPARKTIANYWFRHVWEYWLPIYPGVFLCLTMTKAPIGQFILVEAPLTIAALVAGYFIILHGVRLDGDRRRDYSRSNVWRFVRELTPHLIVLGIVAMFGPVAERIAGFIAGREAGASSGLLGRYWPLLFGLAAATVWLMARRGLRVKMLIGELFSRKVLEMLVVVASIMVMKATLEGCGAVDELSDEFAAHNIPLFVVAAALPFIAGVTVGIAFGFVAASFPLTLPLIAAVPEGERIAWFFLMYSMGHAGMMLSPVHICLLLTTQYFKANLARVYAYLTPLVVCAMTITAALFTLYRWML